jgi:hypothetical protein
MNFGLPLDLTWYKLLTDWGSLIGGGFALIAGVIAYLAGHAQSTATRQAAETQITADRQKYDQEVETVRKSLALELRQIVSRAFGAHNSLAALMSGPPITGRMVETSANVPVPIVYPAVANRIGTLQDEAMDVIIVYQLIEVARDGASWLIRHRASDEIPLPNVAIVAESFLQACLYARGVLPRLRTGIVSHDGKDDELIKKITEAASAWNDLKARTGASRHS